jgi:hypothetical protein
VYPFQYIWKKSSQMILPSQKFVVNRLKILQMIAGASPGGFRSLAFVSQVDHFFQVVHQGYNRVPIRGNDILRMRQVIT